MSGNTFSTVLKNLQSDTVYTVTVVPVYAAGEGQRMSENGKTCKHCTLMNIKGERNKHHPHREV